MEPLVNGTVRPSSARRGRQIMVLADESGSMSYKPVDQRAPDSQYRNLLERISRTGIRVSTRQGPQAITLMQQTLTYDLSTGFPVVPDRDMGKFWRKPIGELCAFINGARTLDELAEFGCDWWGPWATEKKTSSRGLAPGDLGPGSYGGAFHDFPTLENEGFDQFQHLVEQITDLPGDRTHFVSPWIPQYQTRGRGKVTRSTIAPCHGWVHVRVLWRPPAPPYVPAVGRRARGGAVQYRAVCGAHFDAGASHRHPGVALLPHHLGCTHL